MVDPLNGCTADLAFSQRIVAEALHRLEHMALLALVFVDRHRFRTIAFRGDEALALSGRECQIEASQAAPLACGAMADDVVTMDKIVSLSKRRGFILPSSEIYGGIGSSYDYGHYGVLLEEQRQGPMVALAAAGAR